MPTPKISVSSELMKNYKQTSIMSPEKKFEALQNNAGCSLLFSIGTDNVLYLTQEAVEHNTGWIKNDISSALISKNFAGKANVICKTFEAAQSAVDGTIGIATAINDGSNDNLFLSLGNSNITTTWASNPAWVAYPFDNPGKKPSSIIISNIFISETANNNQYIVVDIIRDPSSAEQLISRYYIDTQKTNGYAWQVHDVSIDLEANSYESCLGRQYFNNSPHQPTIDGLYTMGQVDGNAQFIFQPLYNVFNPSIPAPSARLQLPGKLIPDSMAACRKSDQSTDLYVCSQGGLYYFASSNQNDGSTAVLLLSNPMFNGVKKMHARQQNNINIVWGLNGNDQVFYVTCPVGSETTASSWSYPLPIVSGVDIYSPYINCLDNGNTFFVVAENTLQKFYQSPENSLWTSQSITLPSANIQDTQKYSSFTTTIQVTDENNQPMVNEPVTITASSRAGVYINHLYYVIDSQGIQINTDSFGTITVIEWVDSLTGTKLTVSDASGKSTVVNPMDKPMAKIAKLNSVSSLKNATITHDDGSKQALVPSGVSQNDLQQAANSNNQLGQVYNQLTNTNKNLRVRKINPKAMYASPIKVNGLDAIWVEAGDLFKWLESGVEAVIQIIEDAANDVWHFIVTIAGKVYACVLDVVEKVIQAAVYVFNLIKTAIEDLIKFLEFLFGWQDILVTHRVMKNVFLQLSQQSINDLGNFKTEVAAVFQSLQNDVNKWANIPSFGQTAGSATGSNQPLQGQNSSPSNIGLHHFQGGANSVNSSITPVGISQEMFQDLINLIQNEESTLTGACEAIKTDIIDQFNSLTVTQIIQKFIAIVTDTLLQTADNVIQAAIDVFMQLVEGVIGLLNATIEIPVLSWLYKELTGDNLSFLDLVCLIAAIPATILYKIAGGKAPFSKGDDLTDGLIAATSFSQIRQQFYTSSPVVSGRSSGKRLMQTEAAVLEAEQAVLNEEALKIFAFVSDVFAFIGSGVLIITSAIQRTLELVGLDNAIPKTLATISAIGNIAYVSPNISGLINAATSNWYQQMNNVITGISIIKGFVNIPIAAAKNPVFGYVSAGVESFINFAWNVPVIMNIIDNASKWDNKYKSLIPESIGNFGFNLGGMMEFFITIDKEPRSKIILSGVQYGLMLVYGICMPIAGGIYAFAPGQDHS